MAYQLQLGDHVTHGEHGELPRHRATVIILRKPSMGNEMVALACDCGEGVSDIAVCLLRNERD